VIAVDRVPARLELAAELGATHTLDNSAGVLDLVGPVDAAIDTTGNPGVLRTAVDSLAARGTCAVVGAPPAGTEVALDIQGLLTGKRVVGVTLGDGEPETLLPQLVALHARGRLPLEKLVRFYDPADLDSAAEDMHHGRTIKPVIRFA
jgi:aryl-alcohol dehydrogenase